MNGHEGATFLTSDEFAVTCDRVRESFLHTPRFEYHNFEHCLSTAQRAAEGADYHDLDFESTRELVLAALYHDAEYLGNTDDSVNTQTSAKHSTNENVRKLIASTTMPWTPGGKTLVERVLHDADLLQSATVEWSNKLNMEQSRSDITPKGLETLLTTEWGREYYSRVRND